MINRITICAMILFATAGFIIASDLHDKSDALNIEAKTNSNPLVLKETHPLLYEMVQCVSTRLNVPMPRYIKLKSYQHISISSDGHLSHTIEPLSIWMDVLGDLYISQELLIHLKYDEVESLITGAFVDKKDNKIGKVVLAGLTTFCAIGLCMYGLNQYYNLGLGRGTGRIMNDRYVSSSVKADIITGAFALMVVPACAVAKIFSNTLQKQSDKKTAFYTGNQKLINAIRARTRAQDAYIQEGLLSRIIGMLGLTRICDILSYPVREYNDDERVCYLSE